MAVELLWIYTLNKPALESLLDGILRKLSRKARILHPQRLAVYILASKPWTLSRPRWYTLHVRGLLRAWERNRLGFVFATPSRFEVGWNHGNPSSFQVPFKRVEQCTFFFAAFIVLEHTSFIAIAKYTIFLKTYENLGEKYTTSLWCGYVFAKNCYLPSVNHSRTFRTGSLLCCWCCIGDACIFWYRVRSDWIAHTSKTTRLETGPGQVSYSYPWQVCYRNILAIDENFAWTSSLQLEFQFIMSKIRVRL